jgi:hypothetical protein
MKGGRAKSKARSADEKKELLDYVYGPGREQALGDEAEGIHGALPGRRQRSPRGKDGPPAKKRRRQLHGCHTV